MNSELKMLSVVVPVYNVAPYLKDCLDSLENQTLKDIEFIIVNDGSTDGSDKICEKFTKDKPKFKLINKDNGGLMSAWMEGIKHVKGDYIGFVDSDDYVDKQMFEVMYTKAKEKNADIVMCDITNVFMDSKRLNKSPLEKGEYKEEKLKTIFSLVFPKINEPHITNSRCNKIYRKDLFIDNTIYCKSLSRLFEDRFIVPACMFSSKLFIYIDNPYYYYVQRGSSNHSMTSSKLYSRLKELYIVQTEMLKDKGLYEDYVTYLERANIDYIRLLINRNMNLKGNLKGKFITIKQILNDDEYKSTVLKYGQEITSKLGIFLKVSYKINNPYISLFLYEFMFFLIKLTGKKRNLTYGN